MTHHLTLLRGEAIELAIASERPVALLLCRQSSAQCYLMEQVVLEAAAVFDTDAAFARIDPADPLASPERWGVRTLPTLLVLSRGQVVGRIEGLASREACLRGIARAIASVATPEPAP